jgi:hypothetical protein
MSTPRPRFCRITFMDGQSMTLNYKTAQSEAAFRLGEILNRLREVNNLVFELEGKLMIIPMTNVRTVELSPAPDNLPPDIGRATLLE